MDDRSLHSKASQDTFVSLLQLDPTPIDTDKDLPPLPEELQESSQGSEPASSKPASMTHGSSPSGSTSTLGLSGSGHSAVYYLTRIQRYSSYTFTIFTGLHLANTSLIPLVTRSVPASESYLLLAREIYQTRLSEPLLVLLPVAAHVASGVILRLVRRSQNLARYGGATPGVHALHRPHRTGTGSSKNSASNPWPILSPISASGYAFSIFYGAHVFMNRVLPLLVEGDSANIGLAYVSHGFAQHPVVSWAAYLGLIGIGCGHMVWGWAKWLGLAQKAGWHSPSASGHAAYDRATRKRRRRFWFAIHGAAIGSALLWAAGGLGVVARGGLAHGWVANVYDGLYKKVYL